MPTEDFVEKLVEMREVIEPPAAAAAARRRTPEQLARVQQAYEAMAAAEDLDAWAAADLAFHEAVLHATNNELMISLFSVIESALGTFLRAVGANRIQLQVLAAASPEGVRGDPSAPAGGRTPGDAEDGRRLAQQHASARSAEGLNS